MKGLLNSSNRAVGYVSILKKRFESRYFENCIGYIHVCKLTFFFFAAFCLRLVELCEAVDSTVYCLTRVFVWVHMCLLVEHEIQTRNGLSYQNIAPEGH